ncbi:hypothetical protein HMP09_1912 [Sphingomonas sp. HMP9]|uniref:ComEC/Rec2 family competence protein n=1 Tax=Sphingomonas sp. HMP9 TaxID=1517554 RepID=UPI00159679F8|nr:MBL fold metallo-hydrolase [Sphingomonas sp. HMP9]BCA62678.1 hypothetical protein HMP09_1912 [Sphingomonas sp. HMP9]
MTFHLSVLPAMDGDCLLLTFGVDGNCRHVVIDGGRASAYAHLKKRFKAVAGDKGEVELLVLTHIDADHIDGVLKIANDDAQPLRPKHVWYNGYDQMAGIQPFGFAQGDEYSRLIGEREWTLNSGFDSGTVSVETSPKPFDLEGLKITILSPDLAKIAALRRKWSSWRTAEAARIAAREAAPAGLQSLGGGEMPTVLDVAKLASATPEDSEPPDGSSIAFIAEWQGRRALFAGDAHPDLLVSSIQPLAEAAGGRLPIDLLKVSHHGSKGNTTRAFIKLLDCRRFVISTNGKRHGHPDPEAIARLLAYSSGEKTLYFNYRTKWSGPWDADALKLEHDFTTVYGDPDGALEIDI